jgi:dTDP-glucose 4,6-dehydratase
VYHGLFVRRRFALQAAFDAAMWGVAVLVGTMLRYEFDLSKLVGSRIALVAIMAAATQIGIGRLVGLYIHRWRYATFEETLGLVETVFLATVALALLNRYAFHHAIPVSATIIAGPLSFMGMCSGRFVWRLFLERSRRPGEVDSERVIVFGAGEGGSQIIQAMLSHSQSPYVPVAILDDNRDLRNLRIKSVQVRGGRQQIASVADRMGVTTMIIAIPSASSELIRELVALADAADLNTLVLPPVADLFGSGIQLGDIRPLTEADFLGRREINTDIDAVAHYLTGKRVLVTGAGGSIGSELCRQLHRFAPQSVIMLDRDESALQAVQMSIEGRSLLDSRLLVIACIRDADRLREVFEEHRPTVVFHAAALKHLSLLEMYPEEGFKTNVLGTQNLLELAAEFGVTNFVNISTDKAADATSTLGRTKRLAEQLTAHAGHVNEGAFLSVRFGNVLGSRGSVLPLFRSQIERGGPITVTHREVTRFFMTIEEACQLVIQAGAIGNNGEVMVLDMGEPVRIVDLAKRLIAEAERPIEIVFTGLRPGEKLHEDLFGDDEIAGESPHPLISRVDVPAISPEAIGIAPGRNEVATIDLRGVTASPVFGPLEESA